MSEKLRLMSEYEDDELADVVSESEDYASPRHRKPKFSRLEPSKWLKTGVKSLARKCRIVDDTDDGKTNLIQSLFNLINANLGTGILGMPFVIRLGGYWGIFIIVLIGVVGGYTSKNLIGLLYEEAEDGTRIRVRDSYADIGEAFNPRFGRLMVHIVNCIEQFAHCVLLLIMPGTVIAHTFPKSGLSESTWILIISLVIIPTIFVRKMHQLTWASIMSVVIATFISLWVLVYSLMDRTHWSEKTMPGFDLHITPISLGIVMVSYSSQAYMPAIERCMRDPELFEPINDFAYTIVTVFKFGIGIIVFLAFTNHTDQIMTLNLPNNIANSLINVSAIVLSLSFYTVPMFAVFDIIENQLNLPPSLERILNTEDHVLGIKQLTPNLLFRLSVVVSFITIAVSVPHFALLMSFVGNTTGMILVLLYPSLFFIKLRWETLSNNEFIVNGLIMMLGLGAGVFGVNSAARAFYTIYNSYE